MIHLSRQTEALARKLAAANGSSIEDAVAMAIEHAAGATGVGRVRRRQTTDEMLAVGAEIATMPILDQRTSRQIMDDIDAE